MPTYPVYLILYVGIILLSTNGLFAKGIPLDATSITQIRSVIAAIGIIVYLLIFKRAFWISDNKKLMGVYGLGILMGLHWVTFFHAMQVATIAIGMIALYTFPVMVVFMEALVHRSIPHWKDLLSAVLVLLGIVLMAGGDSVSLDSTRLQGVFWGVISAFLFASRNIIQKYYFADVASEKLMLHQVIAISVMLLLFVDTTAVSELASISWIKLIVLGLLTTAGAHTLLVMSYKNLPAKTVAMISCLQPVIGALLAWLFIKEQPTLFIVIGGAIILSVAVYESVNNNK
ncbi:MAG: DMT family transporter [Cellvibrionaceae bacterium]